MTGTDLPGRREQGGEAAQDIYLSVRPEPHRKCAFAIRQGLEVNSAAVGHVLLPSQDLYETAV